MLNIPKIKNKIISKTFIKNVYYFERIPSTNSYCKSLDDKDDVIVITGYQTQGKGRYNRHWESEPNKNLLFSIKKKFDLKFDDIFYINFFFSYFTLDSIINFLSELNIKFDKYSFEIKWPNDLLYKSKKFSGLLIESNVNKKEFIIGIGINVNQTKFSGNDLSNATSLKEITAKKIDLNNLLIKILENFSNHIYLFEKKPYDIYKLWKSKCFMINKLVRYRDLHNIEKNAQIVDINKDGSIKLNIDGRINSFYSGEIKIVSN